MTHEVEKEREVHLLEGRLVIIKRRERGLGIFLWDRKRMRALEGVQEA